MADVIVFNGREFARKRELELNKEINDLKKRGITPKLASILIGDNPASDLYLNLKKKAAERIGAIVEIHKFSETINLEDVITLIQRLNLDNSIHGIMVQLPLPKLIQNSTFQLLESISLAKDVDGLRQNSSFVPATVKAILQIITEAEARFKTQDSSKRIVIVGSKGEVGSRLMKELRLNSPLHGKNYDLSGYDMETKDLRAKTKDADILVSATGVPNLISGDVVREGAVVIDVGSPKGDVNFEEVSKKAAFITPVPGGVGPVTIVSLLENLVSAASKNLG